LRQSPELIFMQYPYPRKASVEHKP
jgi:hypothetical protein